MKIGLSLACAMLLALAAQHVSAAEPAKATTDELPAALAALNADQGKILTTSQASEIRGEGGDWMFLNLAPFVLGPNFGIQNFGGNVTIVGKNIKIGSGNKFKHH